MHDGTIYGEKCLAEDWLHPHHMAKVLLRAKRNSPVDIGRDRDKTIGRERTIAIGLFRRHDLYYRYINTYGILMARLTKKDIAEGMKNIPIERIVLGASSKQGINLTKKQKAFAEQVVATGNKTEAYKRAYNHKGKNTTASRDAYKVANNPNVSTYITALEAHKEVEEYLLPTRLRALAIHKLSSMALNDDLPPAQQLKALELVGKMTEVALFTERRELVHTTDSATLKAKLMEAVQLAITNSNSLRTSTKKTADQLLSELSQPIDADYTEVTHEEMDAMLEDIQEDSISESVTDSTEIPNSEPPLGGITPFLPVRDTADLHSIPDNQSPSVGEGVSNPSWVEKESVIETPPIANPNWK